MIVELILVFNSSGVVVLATCDSGRADFIEATTAATPTATSTIYINPLDSGDIWSLQQVHLLRFRIRQKIECHSAFPAGLGATSQAVCILGALSCAIASVLIVVVKQHYCHAYGLKPDDELIWKIVESETVTESGEIWKVQTVGQNDGPRFLLFSRAKRLNLTTDGFST